MEERTKTKTTTLKFHLKLYSASNGGKTENQKMNVLDEALFTEEGNKKKQSHGKYYKKTS